MSQLKCTAHKSKINTVPKQTSLIRLNANVFEQKVKYN